MAWHYSPVKCPRRRPAILNPDEVQVSDLSEKVLFKYVSYLRFYIGRSPIPHQERMTWGGSN